MRGVVLHEPKDVRVDQFDEPRIELPTDAVLRVVAACVCGSDLWPYRGIEEAHDRRMGHEYVGVVEEVGEDVRNVKPGQFVVGSFFASDNTCEICRAGYQTHCVNRQGAAPDGAQADRVRIALADGTLVATPGIPSDDLVPGLLAASDVLGTGWFGAVAAEAGPGKTVAVVGDGAVGLLAVLAAKQLGAERIVIFSRHEARQKLAREFGATDVVAGRGEDGVAALKELLGGLGAHSVVEAVGTQESLMQAIRAARPGGHVGYVGVFHDVSIPGEELFVSGVHLHGGPAPGRRFLPELIDLIWKRPHRPRQGLRPRTPRPGGRGVRGDGRAARHQGPAPPLNPPEEPLATHRYVLAPGRGHTPSADADRSRAHSSPRAAHHRPGRHRGSSSAARSPTSGGAAVRCSPRSC